MSRNTESNNHYFQVASRLILYSLWTGQVPLKTTLIRLKNGSNKLLETSIFQMAQPKSE